MNRWSTFYGWPHSSWGAYLFHRFNIHSCRFLTGSSPTNRSFCHSTVATNLPIGCPTPTRIRAHISSHWGPAPKSNRQSAAFRICPQIGARILRLRSSPSSAHCNTRRSNPHLSSKISNLSRSPITTSAKEKIWCLSPWLIQIYPGKREPISLKKRATA